MRLPFLSLDGQFLYYDAETGQVVRRWTGSEWGPREQVRVVNELQGDHAVASKDGKTLFFLRTPGSIVVSTRENLETAFRTAAEVIELREAAFPLWLSPDGCRLYITAHPSGQNLKIFVARHGR